MLAYGYQKFGGPTVFEELPQSQLIPTDNQLLIKTLAVNLTEEDRLERLGTIQSVALPHIPGHDVIGQISQVGAAVTDFDVGTVVAAHTNHTYADQVCLDSDLAVTIPTGLDPVTAVSLVTPGIIAYKTVRYFADIQADQTVIVKGAGSPVGLLIIQLAKRLDAHVIEIASDRYANLIATLGVG